MPLMSLPNGWNLFDRPYPKCQIRREYRSVLPVKRFPTAKSTSALKRFKQRFTSVGIPFTIRSKRLTRTFVSLDIPSGFFSLSDREKIFLGEGGSRYNCRAEVAIGVVVRNIWYSGAEGRWILSPMFGPHAPGHYAYWNNTIEPILAGNKTWPPS